MQAGTPKYQAFLKAHDEDARLSGAPPRLLNLRQPWLFELWKVPPGSPGTKVWQWYIALVLVTVPAAYGLARRFVEPAASRLAPGARSGGGRAARLLRAARCRATSAVFRPLLPAPGPRDYAAPAVPYSVAALRAAPCDAEGLIGSGRGVDVDLLPRLRERARVREVPQVAAAGCSGYGRPCGFWRSTAGLARARVASLARSGG